MKIKLNMGDLMSDELRAKYNMDEDGRMKISPEMISALGLDGADLGEDATLKATELNLEEVSLKSLNYRPITALEYDALPAESKTGGQHLVKPSFIFMAIALAIMGYKVIEISNVSQQAGIAPYLILGLFVVVLFASAFVRVQKGIRENSNVIPGKVMFIKTKRPIGDRRQIKYYVSVAFYDDKKYVKEVLSDYYTVKRIKIDSKVYICKGRVYAAE